ncbi:uncharacterized protein LOC129595453 isoform X3 [Paramacrobiotus metropolitanus]|uniref:uncharacterized protein LOC129595453 isoform X3 n=1 Tax=Paramacrobiotus metropolitanus TaxID=2943436 RepID=UPI0024459127|nr:uncharacterized protein LOC129595453 isoform X3 [Paramacrobiotus metropolitanus]
MNPFFPLEEEDFTDVYGAVAGLLKCTTATTERVILEDMYAEQLDSTFLVVKWVLRNTRLKQLIFHHVEMDWEFNFGYKYGDNGVVAVTEDEVEEEGRIVFQRLAKTLKSLAPYCCELRLQRCEFTSLEKMSAVIPQATVTLDAPDLEAQFRDLYEAHLSRDGVDLEEMAEWIRTGSQDVREMVVKPCSHPVFWTMQVQPIILRTGKVTIPAPRRRIVVTNGHWTT